MGPGASMTVPLDSIKSMPAFSPYFPMPPARYRNTRSQTVYFRAEKSAIDRVLPECFDLPDDPICAATGLTVPWSANYGAFDESVLSVKCVIRGRGGLVRACGVPQLEVEHPGG